MSLMFASNYPIGNKSVLVQIIKRWSVIIWDNYGLVYWHMRYSISMFQTRKRNTRIQYVIVNKKLSLK